MTPLCKGPIEVAHFVQNMELNPQIKYSKDRSGYDYFLKIIEISGEEIYGRLLDFKNESIKIGLFPPQAEHAFRKDVKISIQINFIDSIFSLNDIDYPPKIAHQYTISEQDNRKSWMVKVELIGSAHPLIGRLEHVNPQLDCFQDQSNYGIVFPIYFSIEKVPGELDASQQFRLEKFPTSPRFPILQNQSFDKCMSNF